MRAGELRSFYSAFLSSDPTKLLFSFVLCLVSLVYNVLWAEAFHLMIQVEILVRNGCTDTSAQDVCRGIFLVLAFETNSCLLIFHKFLYFYEIRCNSYPSWS